MKCPFANCGIKENITHFDAAAEHIIMVMDTRCTVHVHGPFDNEYAMRKMTDALITEMVKNKIDYTTAARHDID